MKQGRKWGLVILCEVEGCRGGFWLGYLPRGAGYAIVIRRMQREVDGR
jgi:hypothetical protein